MFLVFDFKQSEEQIMLPISLTAFHEKKDSNGRPYLEAHFNGKVFELKGSLGGIHYEIQQAMRPQVATPSGPMLIK